MAVHYPHHKKGNESIVLTMFPLNFILNENPSPQSHYNCLIKHEYDLSSFNRIKFIVEIDDYNANHPHIKRKLWKKRKIKQK